MTSRSINRDAPFWMQASERVEPDVLAAAAADWEWALEYSERLLSDTSESAELLEACVHAVSRVAAGRREAGLPEITSIRSYLRRSFMRRVWKVRDRLLRHAPLSPADLIDAPDLDGAVLIEQLQAFMDLQTLTIFQLRTAGEKWSAIAKKLGTSPHAAESRYHYGVSRARKRVLGNNQLQPGDHTSLEE